MTSHKDMRRAILGAGLARANSDVLVAETLPSPRTDRVVAGAVGAVSRSLDQIQSEIQAAQDLVASGEKVVELEPDLVWDSALRDRLEVSEADQLALVEAIRTGGQQVPILVRPHPQDAGAYQVAYGHRRLAACRKLGVKVKAIVRKLSDSELFLAQGQENTARRDLSFIERAVFAYRLEARGVDREVIMSALATDKTEVSKLISVARAIPEEILIAIGPAPKAGRPRWLRLVDLIKTEEFGRGISELIDRSDFRDRPTDDRFKSVFQFLSMPGIAKVRSDDWRTPDGKIIGKIEQAERSVSISVSKASAPGFAQYLIEQLPDLYEKFAAATPNDKA